jgi:hypothetical protein
MQSKELMHKSLENFRLSGAKVGSEGIAAPAIIRGIDFSDHWSFYQFKYPAIMITDTSFNRYVHYHKDSDTVDKINFTAMNEVYNGLKVMFNDLYIKSP